MTMAASNTSNTQPQDKIQWLASFPKSGNTWARLFLLNLMHPQGRPATLQELGAHSTYTDAEKNPPAPLNRVALGKAHWPYRQERHGRRPAVYIVRDPVDIVPSAADFFGVTVDRMAKEVARDWPMHVSSWWGHTGLAIRYEDMPGNFHNLAQYLNVPNDFESVATAIAHSDFKVISQDEQDHGFSEASEKGGMFFRRGTPGNGREVLTEQQVQRIVDNARPWYQFFGYDRQEG